MLLQQGRTAARRAVQLDQQLQQQRAQVSARPITPQQYEAVSKAYLQAVQCLLAVVEKAKAADTAEEQSQQHIRHSHGDLIIQSTRQQHHQRFSFTESPVDRHSIATPTADAAFAGTPGSAAGGGNSSHIIQESTRTEILRMVDGYLTRAAELRTKGERTGEPYQREQSYDDQQLPVPTPMAMPAPPACTPSVAIAMAIPSPPSHNPGVSSSNSGGGGGGLSVSDADLLELELLTSELGDQFGGGGTGTTTGNSGSGTCSVGDDAGGDGAPSLLATSLPFAREITTSDAAELQPLNTIQIATIAPASAPPRSAAASAPPLGAPAATTHSFDSFAATIPPPPSHTPRSGSDGSGGGGGSGVNDANDHGTASTRTTTTTITNTVGLNDGPNDGKDGGGVVGNNGLSASTSSPQPPPAPMLAADGKSFYLSAIGCGRT